MVNKFVLNDQFEEIISLFEKSSKNIFITGKAGTGKSSLIRYLKNNTKKNLVLLAPTAIAALNINAKTIHSWSGTGISRSGPDKIICLLYTSPSPRDS